MKSLDIWECNSEGACPPAFNIYKTYIPGILCEDAHKTRFNVRTGLLVVNPGETVYKRGIAILKVVK